MSRGAFWFSVACSLALVANMSCVTTSPTKSDETEGAAVLYVDNHSVAHGTTWPGHFHTIGEALSASVTGDEIWVAEGIYSKDSEDFSITSVVTMKNGVGLYGGGFGR